MIMLQESIKISISGLKEKCHKSYLSISELELDEEDNAINFDRNKKRYMLDYLKVRKLNMQDCHSKPIFKC